MASPSQSALQGCKNANWNSPNVLPTYNSFRHDHGALQSIMLKRCDHQYLVFKHHASRPIGVSITATEITRHEQTFKCCKMQMTKSFSFTPT